MTRHELVGIARLAPGRAAIVGAVDLRGLDPGLVDRTAVRVDLVLLRRPAGIVVVHERIQDLRVGARDVDTDAAAKLRRRQPGVRLGPRIAAVGRLEDAPFTVARLDAGIAPLPPGALP